MANLASQVHDCLLRVSSTGTILLKAVEDLKASRPADEFTRVMGEIVKANNPPPQIHEISARIGATYDDTVRSAVITAVETLRGNNDPLDSGTNNTTVRTAVSTVVNTIIVAIQHEVTAALEKAATPSVTPDQNQM